MTTGEQLTKHFLRKFSTRSTDISLMGSMNILMAFFCSVAADSPALNRVQQNIHQTIMCGKDSKLPVIPGQCFRRYAEWISSSKRKYTQVRVKRRAGDFYFLRRLVTRPGWKFPTRPVRRAFVRCASKLLKIAQNGRPTKLLCPLRRTSS